MKLKNLSYLVGAVLGTASLQAQIEIKITGSTAFRSQTYDSIVALYGGGLTTKQPSNATSSSGKVTFVGTISSLYGSQTVTIKTAYSGSVEGMVNLLNAPNPPGIAQPTFLNADGTTDSATAADFALSDVYQDTTDYNSGSGYATLDDYQVGVVPFAWTKGVTAPAGVSNITTQQIQALLGSGTLPLSFFTGNVSDTATVYVAARNKLSGTRLAVYADSGFGATADSSQYKLSGTTAVIDSVGFSSGGASGVQGVLNTVGAPAFLGYLGIADSNGVNSGANRINYNGVAFSLNTVRNGTYSLWSYEHVYVRPGTSSTKQTLVLGSSNPTDPLNSNGLVNSIDTLLGASTTAVQLSTMNVLRNADGGPITAK